MSGWCGTAAQGTHHSASEGLKLRGSHLPDVTSMKYALFLHTCSASVITPRNWADTAVFAVPVLGDHVHILLNVRVQSLNITGDQKEAVNL